MLDWKTTILLKLNKKEQAIQSIIIELICSDKLEHFFKQSEDTLLSLIQNNNFKTDFDNSLKDLSIKTIDKSNWLASFTVHGLKYDFSISNIFPGSNLPHYWTKYFIGQNETLDKTKLIEYIKQRSFYRRLMN